MVDPGQASLTWLHWDFLLENSGPTETVKHLNGHEARLASLWYNPAWTLVVCLSCLFFARSPSQSSQLLPPYCPQSLWLGLNFYCLEYTPPSTWQNFPFLGLAYGNLAYKAFTVFLGQGMNSWATQHLSTPLLSQSRPPWYRLWVPAPWEGADAGTELLLDTSGSSFLSVLHRAAV